MTLLEGNAPLMRHHSKDGVMTLQIENDDDAPCIIENEDVGQVVIPAKGYASFVTDVDDIFWSIFAQGHCVQE